MPGPQSGRSTSQAGVNPQAGTGNNPLSRSSTSSQVGVNSQVGSSHDPLGVNPLGSGSDLSQLCINPLPLVNDNTPLQVVNARPTELSVRALYAAFPGLIGQSSSSSFFNREVVVTAYLQRFGTDAPTNDLTTEQMALRLSRDEPPDDTSQLSEAELESWDDDVSFSRSSNTSYAELRDRYESRLDKQRRRLKRCEFELKEARRELARQQPLIVHTAKDMKILRSLNPVTVKDWVDQFQPNCVQRAVDYMAQDVLSLLDNSFAAQWPGVTLNPPWREWTNLQLLSTLKVMFSVDNNYQSQPFLDRIGSLRLTVDPKNPNVLNNCLLKLNSIIAETPPEIIAKEQMAAIITLVKHTLYKSAKQVDKAIAKDLGALQQDKLPKTLDEFQVRLIREAGNATTKIAEAVRYLSGRSEQEHGQSAIQSGGRSDRSHRKEKRRGDFSSSKDTEPKRPRSTSCTVCGRENHDRSACMFLTEGGRSSWHPDANLNPNTPWVDSPKGKKFLADFNQKTLPYKKDASGNPVTTPQAVNDKLDSLKVKTPSGSSKKESKSEPLVTAYSCYSSFSGQRGGPYRKRH